MFINNYYHYNSGRLDIFKAKYAVAYTVCFNEDCVKFFNSLAQAYKFSLKVERPRFYYRLSSDFYHWYRASVAYCSKYGYTIFDDNDEKSVVFES